MNHEAESQIEKALEIQKTLMAMIQDKIEEFQDPRTGSGYRWCDLAAINQTNKLLGDVAGFLSGCEGSDILAEVSK